VRRVTLAFLVIGNLLAGQAHAEDVAVQPLTRSDCDKAAMSWDDNANVCGQAHAAMKSMPKPESLSQPLTRSECNKAGMTWNVSPFSNPHDSRTAPARLSGWSGKCDVR